KAIHLFLDHRLAAYQVDSGLCDVEVGHQQLEIDCRMLEPVVKNGLPSEASGQESFNPDASHVKFKRGTPEAWPQPLRRLPSSPPRTFAGTSRRARRCRPAFGGP